MKRTPPFRWRLYRALAADLAALWLIAWLLLGKH
jgi:hypothetical protein